MILPTILFSVTWVMWIVTRNVFFMFRWAPGAMYVSQSANQLYTHTYWVKASLVDMVSIQLKASLNFASLSL